MSKLRDKVSIVEGELETPAEGDLRPWVVFTQLRAGGPYLYAGWVDAADAAMAVQFAREHYGQDQECTSLWAIARSSIAGTEPEFPASDKPGSRRTWETFTQAKSGDPHVSAGTVLASSSAEALRLAQEMHTNGSPHSVWVVARDEIAATGRDDLIWRYVSQDYRMARGYAAAVRDKWERIRAERDVREYEKDDLKETF